jgi:AraC family transcriptional regulator
MKPLKINSTLELKERIETRQPVKTICYSLQGDYLTCDYAKAWGAIMKCASKYNLNPSECEYMTVYYDDPSVTEAGKQRADVCLATPVEIIPDDGVQTKEIYGGKFAVYLYKGPYQQLGSVYDTIFGKYIPDGGYKLDDSRIAMLEKYLNDPADTKPEDLVTEIYVPIL